MGKWVSLTLSHGQYVLGEAEEFDLAGGRYVLDETGESDSVVCIV
jgi:hypothetical protein